MERRSLRFQAFCTNLYLWRRSPGPALPMEWFLSMRFPVPTSLHLEALQLKPGLLARFESAGGSDLHVHTLPFSFNPGYAVTGTLGIGV